MSEPELDPYMEALGRRAYFSWCDALNQKAQTWASMPYKERAAWTRAAREAGQNFPAPVMIEMSMRGPNSVEAAPLKMTFMCNDDVEGVERVIKQFRGMLLDHLSLR